MRRWEKKVPLDDGVLSVSIWEPDSPILTLVCVHGWTLDRHSFSGQQALVPQGVRLVAFDRRGFGSNKLPPGLDRELADLDQLLVHFPSPVYAFGVSQGARLLLRYAAQTPVTLAGLFLQGGLVDGLPAEINEIPYARYASLLRQGNQSAFSKEWLAHPLMRSGVPAEQLSSVAQLIGGYEGRDLFAAPANAISDDLTGVLPAVFASSGLPLWVIEAAHESEARRAHARFLIEKCGARAVPMPGGHLCHFTHAEEMNARLLAALGVIRHGADGGQQIGSQL